MASEAVVSVVVEKLAELLTNEVIFLGGVKDQVEWIHGELRQIQCFLKDADKKEEGNAQVKNWVADIRDVAYDAEDVIEQFIAQQRRRGFAKRYASFFCNLNALHKIGKEIERTKNKIRDISNRRLTYGIENISGSSRGETSSSASERQNQRRTSPNFDEPDVVGMEKDVKELEARLIKEPTCRCVISIVGMGGLGKTTLARRLYNSDSVKIHFDTRAWVYVSQEYNTKDLLQDIGKKVMSFEEEKLRKMNEEELKNKLCAFLKERKYLIVMDDVWRIDVWDGLRIVFPDTENGSRVVFTTRNKEVALHADPVSPPHELQLLSDDDSWALFCKKVFIVDDSHQTVGTCPDRPSKELVEIGKKIINKCGGLPLAIVVLGGFLSRKPRSIRDWSKVLERVNWQLNQDQTQCSEILALSYNDLPFYLKSCFLYVGIFPEDSEISVERLIQLWIAEGFVQQRGDELVEDVAEDYLEELIDRCIIQIAGRRANGSVETCRIHDLLRDLSISKAKEVIFFQTHPLSATDSRFRRFVVHSAVENNSYVEHSTHQHIRSVLTFGLLDHRILYSVFHRRAVFGMLRVLDLDSGKDIFENPTKVSRGVGKLIHLRYLRLSGFRLKMFSSSIHKLRNLQTLDLRGTRMSKYDRSMISEMHQIRHLYLSGWTKYSDDAVALEPPRRAGSSYSLTTRNLQTLCGLDIEKKSRVKDGWDKYTKLRKLWVHGVESQVEALAGWIAKLDHLESLRLFDNSKFRKPVERLIISSKNHINLYEMVLIGVWIEKLPHPHEFPPNLTNLRLVICKVEEDPLPMLGKLPNLKFLWIYDLKLTKQENEMVCLAGGFPQLQDLKLVCLPILEEWRVEEGALPSLKELELDGSDKLKMLPDGLWHVTTLQELKLYNMSNELKARVEKNVGEDWDKIAHVPSITIR